jgi:hypothetical protein
MRAFSSGEDFKKISSPTKIKHNNKGTITKQRTTIIPLVFMIGKGNLVKLQNYFP